MCVLEFLEHLTELRECATYRGDGRRSAPPLPASSTAATRPTSSGQMATYSKIAAAVSLFKHALVATKRHTFASSFRRFCLDPRLCLRLRSIQRSQCRRLVVRREDFGIPVRRVI